jgi:hypothetical protein
MVKCLYCHNILKIRQQKQRYFCNDNCSYLYRKEFPDKLLPSFHNDTIIKLNEVINGTINISQTFRTKENCDIETETTNYEVEVYSYYTKWRDKYKRKRDNKKHILVVAINPIIKEFFDEILIIND